MKKGFTLIELLVVIVIIGILATLATVALSSARGKARDARRVSDVKQIQTALELYYNEAQGYPSQIVAGSPINKDAETYMAKVPSNALPVDGTACAGAGSTYVYTPTGTGTGTPTIYPGYTLSYCLGATTGNITAGGHTASPSGIQ